MYTQHWKLTLTCRGKFIWVTCSRIQKFCLPHSVSCPVNRNITKWIVSSFGIVSKGCTFLFLSLEWHHRATRGATVSMSAFLACHQCYCAGSSLAWGLNLPPSPSSSSSFSHKALPSSANVQSHLTSSFADDGNASWYSVCRVPMVEWRLDCENCRHLTVVSLHDTGPRSYLTFTAALSSSLPLRWSSG